MSMCPSCGASCAASAAICAACGSGLAGVMVAEARSTDSARPETQAERKRKLVVTAVLLAALAIAIGVVAFKH